MIVTIIGTGYVGLVTGACLASHGHTVRCVEVSQERLHEFRGRVVNKSFRVQTRFGKLDLPAEQVVGMAIEPPRG